MSLSEKDRALIERIAPWLLPPPNAKVAATLAALLQAAREEASQGAGEPVAWAIYWRHGVSLHASREEAERAPGRTVQEPVPLFTSPPDPQARIAALEGALRGLADEFEQVIRRTLSDLPPRYADELIANNPKLGPARAVLNPTDQAATKGDDHGA